MLPLEREVFEVWMRKLSDPRMRRVLEVAADTFGWQPAAGPGRRGVGMACFIDAGTYVPPWRQRGFRCDRRAFGPIADDTAARQAGARQPAS